MKRIRLAGGAEAVVDDDDFEALSRQRWRLHSKGYAQTSHWPRDYMHRVVAERMLGRELATEEQVHHGPGGRLDNRRSNLRVCADALRHKAEHFEHPGVRWDRQRGRWIARPTIDRRKVFLGRFGTKQEALSAVKEARNAATAA